MIMVRLNNKNKMIRSSKLGLKFANSGKRDILLNFLIEYTKVVQFFIDEIWSLDKISTLLPKNITNKCVATISKRAIQCAAKQASGIVRGTKQKHKQRLFVYHKLLKNNKLENAAKLKTIIDQYPINKPILQNILSAELDSRFVKTDTEKHNHFEIWITLSSFGKKMKLNIPVKRTVHFNKLFNSGVLKRGVRLSKNNITFCFELPDVLQKEIGEKVGIDIGISRVFTASNNQISLPDNHGHMLASILQKISRKAKGSNAFRRASTHRKNHINWSLNRLNLSGIKQLNVENLRNVRKNKRISRQLSHWTYTDIVGKLESLCEENGVHFNRVNQAYTSQQCSSCGKIDKKNRRGSIYSCSCGNKMDADFNASLNLKSL